MNFWDKRYQSDDYVYGLEPNDFLRDHLSYLPPGRLLSLGEGEGRNAVFLAQNGFDVTAIDSSEVGLNKAKQLASKNHVNISIKVEDLSQFEQPENDWDVILAIYCHLPPELRLSLYPKIARSLKPGGVFVLEAYSPEQLEYRTGGPGSVDMLIPLEELESGFMGFHLSVSRKVVRTVNEGTFHTGEASVVQFIAKKPNA